MNLLKNHLIIIYIVVTTFLAPMIAVLTKNVGVPLQPIDIELTINKISLTQKGYIQFLKYVRKVPPLRDYTFCIWVKSNNLTYSHPLLSYSKHEEKRLIRVWITPGGASLNLEIVNKMIFELPIDFIENKWYHICQSWSSYHGIWSVYINGKLKSSGTKPELRGLVIEGGGDIVVGQEYTDFDKGLDDGIEGDIFGFNFILSSTTPKIDYHLRRSYETSSVQSIEEIPQVLGYFNNEPNRRSKSFLDFSGNLLGSVMNFFGEQRIPSHKHLSSKRIQLLNNVEDLSSVKTQGLKLVELGYNNCFLGRGAPLSGRDVLISWTRTPVRVFGGAVLKNVLPFCK